MEETLTSRERVLAALRHEEADRVPIDFGAFRSSGIHAGLYARLRRYLGLPEKRVRLYDVMQQLAEPDEDILDFFHADVLQVHRLCPSFGIPIDSWKEGSLPDGTPAEVPREFDPVPLEGGGWEIRRNGTPIARMTSGGLYFDAVHFPLADVETVAELEKRFSRPGVSEREIAFLKKQLDKVSGSKRAVLYCFGGNIFEGGHGLMGYAAYMYNVAANPKLIEALSSLLAESYVSDLSVLLPIVEGKVDIIACGDDLGIQTGLQISPQDYRRLIKPYQKRVYEYIRTNSSAYLFLHSCGSIVELLEDLIEIGVQVINPVQISAKGMDPEALKRRFGRDLTFWGGGCDTQHVLPYGSPEEVRLNVKRNMKALKPGGGFVFTQVHNILDKVPPENVRVMYETALQEGWYR